MCVKFPGYVLLISVVQSVSAQVGIPPAYASRFPYYTGNTKHEIEAKLPSGNYYRTIEIPPGMIDTGGVSDASLIIQSFLDRAAATAVNDTLVSVQLPGGRIRITNEIYIPSNTLLKGQGKATTLLIATGENKHGIVIAPRHHARVMKLRLMENVACGESEVRVDSRDYKAYTQVYGPMKYVTLQHLDDAGLITSSWAKGSIMEHYFIAEVKLNGQSAIIKIGHPLSGISLPKTSQDVSMGTRSAFIADTTLTAVFCHPFVENAGVSCISMQRMDSTASQTSNIFLDKAYNCLVREVTSVSTNFSHICMQNSAFNIIKRCDLRKSHGYGGGGRAYGIVMQMGSSSNVVMDNYLSQLRHSILLQAGANGNVIYANMSENTFWNEGLFPTDASGDIVLHGNYVYANLFEMNNVRQVVLDNSHGRNGPRNIFFRNQLNNYGLLLSAANGSDSQVFIGNEINSMEAFKGLYLLKDKGHFELGNRVKGVIITGQDGSYKQFLWKGGCGQSEQDAVDLVCFPKADQAPYGYPFDPSDDSLPAVSRLHQEGNNTCDAYYDAQFGLPLSDSPKSYRAGLLVFPNPASDEVFLEVRIKGVLTVFDLQGKAMKVMDIMEGRNVLLLEGFQPGLYLLQFVEAGGNTASCRLMVL